MAGGPVRIFGACCQNAAKPRVELTVCKSYSIPAGVPRNFCRFACRCLALWPQGHTMTLSVKNFFDSYENKNKWQRDPNEPAQGGKKAVRSDPPPLRWSDLRYVFWHQVSPHGSPTDRELNAEKFVRL
jgi:hypothetical protein